MIVSFADKATEAIANGERVVRFAFIEKSIRRKLRMLEIAGNLNDLRIPPGNHLEKLQGSLSDFHSIRVNEQWRICFRWTLNGPSEVQLVDYHK